MLALQCAFCRPLCCFACNAAGEVQDFVGVKQIDVCVSVHVEHELEMLQPCISESCCGTIVLNKRLLL